MQELQLVDCCHLLCQARLKTLRPVRGGIAGANPDLVVSVNPVKPRKGCFEVRDASGKMYVSLLDLPRPFTKLKALDLDELAATIAAGSAPQA
ncbi:hypothetical protein WJX81_007378 [Elliptochloris bilobata]|uniref:Uncharacterized protein n=1 Tax=Elliptochloris bilobata TaxID=381761 RepID=A0AAW1RUN3_9CHLO